METDEETTGPRPEEEPRPPLPVEDEPPLLVDEDEPSEPAAANEALWFDGRRLNFVRNRNTNCRYHLSDAITAAERHRLLETVICPRI